jgi:predicted nucleotidyltransferase
MDKIRIKGFLQEKISEVCGDNLEGIVLFGSFVEESVQYRDIDVLIILREQKIPQSHKRKLRAKIRRKLLGISIPIELYIWNQRQFASLSLLHFGIGLNHIILYDRNDWVLKVLTELKQLMVRWKTKKIYLPDKTWVILPKGKILREGTIPLGQELVPLENA